MTIQSTDYIKINRGGTPGVAGSGTEYVERVANLPGGTAGIVADPKFTGTVTITTPGTARQSMVIKSNLPALGPFQGFGRNYFDNFGCFQTQGWMTISGSFNDKSKNANLAADEIEVIYPGASSANPTLYAGNRINGFTGGMLGISNDTVGPCLLIQENFLRSGGNVAVGAVPVAGGAGYVVGDVVSVSGGTATAETSTIYNGAALAGAGYTVGDILTVVGGTGTPATIRVTSVAATAIVNALVGNTAVGGVLTAQLVTPGAYSVLPSLTYPVTGGTGTGFFGSMIWPSKGVTRLTVSAVSAGAITKLTVARPGLYTSLPAGNVALTGGSGTNATAAITWSDKAQSSRAVELMDYTKSIRFQMRGDGTAVWGNAQDIDLFVASNATLYALDNANLATDATFNAPSVVAPTASLGNTVVNGASRTMTATAGDTVDIGSLLFTDPVSLSSAGGAFRLLVTTYSYSGGGALSKIYDVTTSYSATGGAWQTLSATSSASQPGYPADFAVDINVAAGPVSLRLRSVSGPALFVMVSILANGVPGSVTFTPSTATTTGGAVPTVSYGIASLAALSVTGDGQIGNAGFHSVTRTLTATAASTVAIGSINFSDAINNYAAGGAIRLEVTTFGATAGTASAKMFEITSSYNQTSGAWQLMAPVAQALQTGYIADFAVDCMVSATVVSFRLRTVTNPALTAMVTLHVNGSAANAVFTASSTTATGVTVPTAIMASRSPQSQDTVAKAIASGVTNGVTLTIPLGAPYYLVNPGLAVGVAALPSLVVTFPANPVEGQRQSICFGQAVTGLYLTGPNAQYGWTNGSAVAQYQKLEYTFNAATTQWYRTQ